MTIRFCDGPTLNRAVVAAVTTLDRHAAEVDSLNVFPVPDGDTGRNMLVTMRTALEHTEWLEPGERSLTRIADALAHGAMMGARGNSGVILSQVLRGMADAVKGHRRGDGLTLAHALRGGSKAADAAVAHPVEGTILTVVRRAADAAVATAERDPSLGAVLAAAVEAAEEAVLRTPDQLPMLAEAGVVDAGGRGFELLLRGALLGMADDVDRVEGRTSARRVAPVAPDQAGWGYETMYLLTAREGTRLDIERMRTQLATMGDSVLVVGDERMARVHLHSERPDLAIGYGLRRGAVSRVTVENMDLLSAGEREERAAELLGSPLPAPGPVSAGRPIVAPVAAVRRAVPAPADAPRPDFAVVAVAVGAGIAAAFDAAGVRSLVPGGQGDNPSTGELVAAIEATRARSVVLLPDNPNVRLAAEQAATLVRDTEVHVVPTRNAAEGLAAVLAVDPRLDATANAQRMRDAAARVRSFIVTHAVRDATLGGRKVRRGQALAMDPRDTILANGPDRVAVALEAIGAIADGAELLTIHYGADADLDEAERLAGLAALALPDVAVEVVHGGQPHHAYLVAAE
ncbi:MAG: DAK2 domain-containing protein [Chloroflexota bacterium]